MEQIRRVTKDQAVEVLTLDRPVMVDGEQRKELLFRSMTALDRRDADRLDNATDRAMYLARVLCGMTAEEFDQVLEQSPWDTYDKIVAVVMGFMAPGRATGARA